MKLYNVLGTVILLSLIPTGVKAASFTKEFYSTGVQAQTAIQAGAVAQTWYSKEGDNPSIILGSHTIYQKETINNGKVILSEPVQILYFHAINRVLLATIPFGTTGFDVPSHPPGTYEPREGDKPITKGGIRIVGNVNAGYSAVIPLTPDMHTNPNQISASIEVNPLVPGNGPQIPVRNGGAVIQTPLQDSVKTTLRGEAIAGQPMDGDTVHSADSTAAVSLEAQQTFFRSITNQAPPPPFKVYLRNGILIGTVSEIFDNKKRAIYSDPVFVTLDNLDTGESFIEQVITFDVETNNASFSISDLGIRLAINKSLPGSSVRFGFSNESDWVLNPYNYGALLNQDGLTAVGLTPLSGWTVQTTQDTIEAFFDFQGQQPFDSAIIRPPDSLFTTTGNYSYSAGDGAAIYEIKTAATVPEPSANLSLLALGTLGAASTLKRKLKSSKPSEKETTKIS